MNNYSVISYQVTCFSYQVTVLFLIKYSISINISLLTFSLVVTLTNFKLINDGLTVYL